MSDTTVRTQQDRRFRFESGRHRIQYKFNCISKNTRNNFIFLKLITKIEKNNLYIVWSANNNNSIDNI